MVTSKRLIGSYQVYRAYTTNHGQWRDCGHDHAVKTNAEKCAKEHNGLETTEILPLEISEGSFNEYPAWRVGLITKYHLYEEDIQGSGRQIGCCLDPMTKASEQGNAISITEVAQTDGDTLVIPEVVWGEAWS